MLVMYAPWGDPVQANPVAEDQASVHSLEALLEAVEGGLPKRGHAMLFCGESLRLEIALTRREGDATIKWGTHGHESWAFKATLLRFARGDDPLRLLVETSEDGIALFRGWVVKRTRDAFWASPLSPEQARQFWEFCPAHTHLVAS